MRSHQEYLYLSRRVLFTFITISVVGVCVVVADDLDNFSFNNGQLINDFFYENQDLSALQVDDWEEEESTVEDKQAHVRTALLNALKDNKQLRRFAEVLPIIRVMSSPQRIALAALVSAQIAHEKDPGSEGNGLSLPQVRRMFGDDPELILPVTLDIANLIRDTTRARGRSFASEHELVPSAQALRRMLELPSKGHGDDDDEEDEDEHIGEVLVTSGDDRDLSNEVVLGNSTNIRDNFRDFKPLFDDSVTTRKNNATESPRPMKFAKDQLAMPSDDRLHMSVALPPSNETLLVFNETDISNEDLPQAEQLRWRKRPIPFKTNHYRRPGLSHIANDLLNSDQKAMNCFSRSLCLSADDYPIDSIRASIRRNKNAMAALIVEYRDKEDEIQNIDISDKPDLDRLDDEGTNAVPGTMCPSIVRYARPQKARSATGHWKYVVNTGEHTQTLRLEKCSRPNEPCTYLTENFKSRCVQVYNYHRLLSWDANRGLHVDIFKIPTCCSCHIDDYKIAYPPVSAQKESSREVFPGKEFSNEADESDHLGEDSQLYERDVNQFHFSPGNTNKKYVKTNGGTRGLDSKYRPTLIRDSEFESMMEDTESTTQTYNTIAMYPVSTGRRKPFTKNQGLPSFLEAPKPPRNRFPTSHKIIPLTSNTFKRGVGAFNNFDFNKRHNIRRPARFGDNFPLDSIYDSSEDKLNHFTMQGYDITTDMYDSLQKSPPWQRMVNTNPRATLLQPSSSNKRILYNRTPSIKTTTARPIKLHNLDHTTTKIRRPTTEFEYDSDYSDDKDKKADEDKKRINYNYHPIIEFFGGTTKNRGAESRSGDTEILSSGESDWRPMKAP